MHTSLHMSVHPSMHTSIPMSMHLFIYLSMPISMHSSADFCTHHSPCLEDNIRVERMDYLDAQGPTHGRWV